MIFLILLLLPVSSSDPYALQREAMVRSQMITRGITHEPTLTAMRSVPRHLFVPEIRRDDAYDDRPLPIGYGQTISQPFMVAYMTQTIQPEPHHRILEIGTGSGYQAAILSPIVDSVFTIEIVKELAATATERLNSLGYHNAVVLHGDGYSGWQEKGPFDAIVVTAAAEHIPPPLLKQLKDGGRMVIPVGAPFTVQTLMLVEKQGDDIRTTSLMPVRFVPFTGKR